MSIIQRIPGTNFMVLNGMATQLKTNTLDTSTPEGVAIPTSLIKECVGALPVFATYGVGRNPETNDFTSFLDAFL